MRPEGPVIRFVSWYSFGIRSVSVRYPFGIRWYPFGIRSVSVGICSVSVRYPLVSVRYPLVSVRYPCGIRWYPFGICSVCYHRSIGDSYVCFLARETFYQHDVTHYSKAGTATVRPVERAIRKSAHEAPRSVRYPLVSVWYPCGVSWYPCCVHSCDVPWNLVPAYPIQNGMAPHNITILAACRHLNLAKGASLLPAASRPPRHREGRHPASFKPRGAACRHLQT